MKNRGTESTDYKRVVRAIVTLNGRDHEGTGEVHAKKEVSRGEFYGDDVELVEFIDLQGNISFMASFSLRDEAAFDFLKDANYRMRLVIERVDTP